jgi:hypothetical protein
MTENIETIAKALNLPVGSATAFVAYAQDAGNWSGNPWVNGNVNFGRATGGYIKKLVESGLVELGSDGEETYLIFTPAGVEAAAVAGVDLSWIHPLTERIDAMNADTKTITVMGQSVTLTTDKMYVVVVLRHCRTSHRYGCVRQLHPRRLDHGRPRRGHPQPASS